MSFLEAERVSLRCMRLFEAEVCLPEVYEAIELDNSS